MKIANGVYVFEIESEVLLGRRKVFPVVVRDGSELVLFDTCFPGQLSYLVGEFTKEGLNIKNLTKIVLTHQDIDHTGNISDIKVFAKDIEILAHKVETPYINGEKTPLKLAKFEADYENLSDDLKKRCEWFKKAFAKNRVDVTTSFEDDDVLDLLGGIEVVFAPGHTAGHTCYYFRESKTLIAGDMLTIKDGELVIADESIHDNIVEVKKSVEKLLKYDIKTVVTFHGGVYTGEVNNAIEKLVK